MKEDFGDHQEKDWSGTSAHELVQETLQDLIEFSSILEGLCQQCSDTSQKKADFLKYFIQLIDGLSIFIEAIAHVVQLMNLDILQPVNRLELELLSILRELEESHETGRIKGMEEKIKNRLSPNLFEWRTKGLPALIRARDN